MTALALIVMLVDLFVRKKEVIALISMAGVALVGLSLLGPRGKTSGQCLFLTATVRFLN